MFSSLTPKPTGVLRQEATAVPDVVSNA